MRAFNQVYPLRFPACQSRQQTYGRKVGKPPFRRRLDPYFISVVGFFDYLFRL